MSEKQLKDLIKVKELELQELKKQLKDIQQQTTPATQTIDYFELVKMDNIKEILNTLEVKQLKSVAKEGGIKLITNSKIKIINTIDEVITARNNKGKVFR